MKTSWEQSLKYVIHVSYYCLSQQISGISRLLKTGSQVNTQLRTNARSNTIIGSLPAGQFLVSEDWVDKLYLQRNSWKGWWALPHKQGGREVFILHKTDQQFLHDSILTDLLEDLGIRAIHGHSILNFKNGCICSSYFCIHPRNMIVISLFIGGWFIDICIFSFVEIMIAVSEFLQNLYLTTNSLSGRASIFIVFQELRKWMQLNHSFDLL